jgi:hypothetical protein
MIEAWNEVQGSKKTSGTGDPDELIRRLETQGMLGE